MTVKNVNKGGIIRIENALKDNTLRAKAEFLRRGRDYLRTLRELRQSYFLAPPRS